VVVLCAPMRVIWSRSVSLLMTPTTKINSCFAFLRCAAGELSTLLLASEDDELDASAPVSARAGGVDVAGVSVGDMM